MIDEIKYKILTSKQKLWMNIIVLETIYDNKGIPESFWYHPVEINFSMN